MLFASVPQSNDAAQYVPALTRTLFLIGLGLCLALSILYLVAYAVGRALKRPMKGDFFDVIELVISKCLSIGCFFSVAFGLSIFGIQIFLWMKTGAWNGVSIATAFWLFGLNLSTIYSPTDWKGLAAIVSWVLAFPLSLTVLLIGAFAYLKASEIRETWEQIISGRGSHPQPGDPDYLDWAKVQHSVMPKRRYYG